MAKRTKLQIQEDKKKLKKEKNKSLSKLNTYLDQINQISEENLKKVNQFLFLFYKCEMVYKTLYSEMKKIRDEEKIDVKTTKFNVQFFEAALRFFGISYIHENMNIMFMAEKSYLRIRDNIVHGLKMESISFVIENYDEMEAMMLAFLEQVAMGNPE